jgi:2-aminoadipate transaminase
MTDFSSLFRPGVPAAAGRFTGFPKYNFVGGHNDPTRIPVEALADCAAAALRREGSLLALYNLGHGPLGHIGMRDLVVDKLKRHRGLEVTREEVLLTSGSLQGLDLVNSLFCAAGDTVLVEELSYGGAISRLKTLGVKIVPMPLDDDGIRMDALADILADIRLRDERDSGRAAAPLLMADDAVLLDTSNLSIEQAADAARRIVETARARWT